VEHLSAGHAEHPEATQLVLAHSHGGNIALRALHLLHQPDGSRLCEADGANPLVVTLATPFIEVHHADFGNEHALVRIAVAVALWMPTWIFIKTLFPWNEFGILIRVAVSLAFVLSLWFWLSKRSDRRRHKQVEAEPLRDWTK
jgi:alpha-beta hydrolase superfamily lysophospholipase